MKLWVLVGLLVIVAIVVGALVLWRGMLSLTQGETTRFEAKVLLALRQREMNEKDLVAKMDREEPALLGVSQAALVRRALAVSVRRGYAREGKEGRFRLTNEGRTFLNSAAKEAQRVRGSRKEGSA